MANWLLVRSKSQNCARSQDLRRGTERGEEGNGGEGNLLTIVPTLSRRLVYTCTSCSPGGRTTTFWLVTNSTLRCPQDWYPDVRSHNLSKKSQRIPISMRRQPLTSFGNLTYTSVPANFLSIRKANPSGNKRPIPHPSKDTSSKDPPKYL